MIKLDERTISKLKSSSKISTIFDSIVQLVYNSIDANSTSITVQYNFNKFYIEIKDNGDGLDENGLILVGERYFTKVFIL
jgi:DNA mismatch repair ATPase MutL